MWNLLQVAVDSDCPILRWIAALPDHNCSIAVLLDHFWQFWQTSCVASQAVSAAVSADGVAAAAVDSTWNHAAEKAKAAVGQSAAAVVSPRGSISANSVAAADDAGVKEHFFDPLGGAGYAALGDIA